MQNNFHYYYNNVPGKGLCRNNLIYTSMINKDKTVFCKWYYNDTDYHLGMNVVDPELMDEKWTREKRFLTMMAEKYPQHVPRILNIDDDERKIFLEIDGPDLWELSSCGVYPYEKVLPDWREQMLEIIQAHKDIGIYKYSMHPSSYFVVNGKLKSINYFFCYEDNDDEISLKSVLSHISEERQKDLIPKMERSGIKLEAKTPFKKIQMLAFESFKTNFDDDVMEEAKKIYAT